MTELVSDGTELSEFPEFRSLQVVQTSFRQRSLAAARPTRGMRSMVYFYGSDVAAFRIPRQIGHYATQARRPYAEALRRMCRVLWSAWKLLIPVRLEYGCYADDDTLRLKTTARCRTGYLACCDGYLSLAPCAGQPRAVQWWTVAFEGLLRVRALHGLETVYAQHPRLQPPELRLVERHGRLYALYDRDRLVKTFRSPEPARRLAARCELPLYEAGAESPEPLWLPPGQRRIALRPRD